MLLEDARLGYFWRSKSMPAVDSTENAPILIYAVLLVGLGRLRYSFISALWSLFDLKLRDVSGFDDYLTVFTYFYI